MPVVNRSKGTLIAAKVRRADSFFSRLKGLLGTDSLPEGESLLIYPCSSIHTLGMNYPIDALFVNSQSIVVKVEKELSPGSLAGASKAHYVIELPAGTADKTVCQIGDRIAVLSDD